MAVIARLREIATFHENQMTWRIFRRRFSVQTFIGVVRAPNHSAASKKRFNNSKSLAKRISSGCSLSHEIFDLPSPVFSRSLLRPLRLSTGEAHRLRKASEELDCIINPPRRPTRNRRT